MSSERREVEFLGVDWTDAGIAEVTSAVIALASSPDFSYVVTPNVDHVVRLHGEEGLAVPYARAALRLCDSRIIGHLARLSGIELPVVPGSDLTRKLIEDAPLETRIIVIGGNPELHVALRYLYPQRSWRFLAPPMGLRENQEARLAVAEFVEKGEVGIILFAVGSPQSELCCAEILARQKAGGVALCIGASLEFLTGAKRRAPEWMQRLSLEWLHRLLSEPRRLWRRYLVDGPQIFGIWCRWQYGPARAGRDRSDSTPFDGD